MGEVSEVFNEQVLAKLPGNTAIGHVRYSTTGVSNIKNAQPLVVKFMKGYLSLAHNGNLVNSDEWRAKLEAKGSIFQATSDTAVVLHLIAHANGKPIEQAIDFALSKLKGAFSMIFLSPTKMIAVRDPYGFRPLCIGKLENGGFVVASETCALDLINAEYVRDVEPGEMVIIEKSGLKSRRFAKAKTKKAMCVFEFIYFSRPDSMIFGKSVLAVRRQLGATLAYECLATGLKADVVIGVPDSANSAAIGFSHASGIPYETGLIRNHYIGRTFIEPSQHIRDFGAKIKYNPVKDLLRGKRVVVVDDSIVRGTTMRKLVKMIRDAGAKEVHLAISSPPVIAPCFYGIDTPSKDELIGAQHTVPEIRKYMGVDSLNYLSVKGLLKSAEIPAGDFCDACFTDNYIVK
jgi:amidophosphoribosyltransferase